MLENITPGQTGTSSLRVGPEHTAAKIGSGVIPVLAPVMINVIEAAALAYCARKLCWCIRTLGTRLDVSHIAATPVRMTVTAQAIVTKVEGRMIFFKVTATRRKDLIGEGTHGRRVVVNVERFAERVRRKSRP